MQSYAWKYRSHITSVISHLLVSTNEAVIYPSAVAMTVTESFQLTIWDDVILTSIEIINIQSSFVNDEHQNYSDQNDP